MAIVRAVIKATGEKVLLINSEDHNGQKSHQVLTKEGMRYYLYTSISITSISPSIPTKLTTQQRFKR